MSKMAHNENARYARNVPYNLMRQENIAIAMAYFCVGIVGSFLHTPLVVYLVKDLNAEPQMQHAVEILHHLPWTLKLIFGFISDAFPIMGMHRAPYFGIGAIVYSISFIAYGLLGVNNVILLAFCVFVGTLGLIQMDVMADTMVVQRAKFEPTEIHGQMQASCYALRFAGSLTGAILGATFCNKKQLGWGLNYHQVSLIDGMFPLVLVIPMLFT